MSNHFHLLLKPTPGQSISRILQSLTVAHTWRHHRRQGTSGHVWQGRFRSPVIQDGDHLLVVLRYIEAKPVRAAMVADPCEYTWSSHRCHGARHADPILDSFPEWEQLGRTQPERRARWRRKVRGEQPAKELDGVRSSVRVAGPAVQRTGSRSFPIASASSVSRAVVVARRAAKRCSDTGIPKRCSDTGIPLTTSQACETCRERPSASAGTGWRPGELPARPAACFRLAGRSPSAARCSGPRPGREHECRIITR